MGAGKRCGARCAGDPIRGGSCAGRKFLCASLAAWSTLEAPLGGRVFQVATVRRNPQSQAELQPRIEPQAVNQERAPARARNPAEKKYAESSKVGQRSKRPQKEKAAIL